MINIYQSKLAEARNYAYLAKVNVLTYDDAKAKAQPLIDEVNARGREIAKKFGKTFKPITFSGLVR